ncbi:MAG: hypothetical protein AAES65_01380 [Candidatus Thiodiazotropha sp. (ex. Lucinoma kazani)]
MSTRNDHKPFKIALLGVSNRDMAMLELFLHNQKQDRYAIVPEQHAHLCILDLDGINGKKLLQHQRNHYPHRPIVALSVRDLDIDSVQFLRKPIKVDLLKTIIDFYRNEPTQKNIETEKNKALPKQSAPPVTTGQTVTGEKRKPVGFAANNTQNVVRNLETLTRITHECCGIENNIDLVNGAARGKLYYDPKILFQHILEKAIIRCRKDAYPVVLHLPGGKSITLLPTAGVALTDLSDSRLRPRCLMAVKPDEIRIENPRYSEANLLQFSKQAPQDLDALLWKVTLWSARGRLPLNTDIHAPVLLRQWPNLTRLLSIPPFLRIAALWSKTPLSLAQTVDTLGMEARYVCAFFTACHTLGLANLQSIPQGEEMVQMGNAEPSRKGLLGRILNHLRAA